MLGDILPSSVVAVEAFEDDPDVVLFPEEEAVIAKAVTKRRVEFTTARACARVALGSLVCRQCPSCPDRTAPRCGLRA